MVQGTSQFEPILMNSSEKDIASRKASYEAVQKQAQQSRTPTPGSSKTQTSQTSNPWGPVFKNKSHFVDMHIC